MPLSLKVNRILAVYRAHLESHTPITLLIGPNRSGKTQLMHWLYSMAWSAWMKQTDSQRKFEAYLKQKLKNVFLVRRHAELVSWGMPSGAVELGLNGWKVSVKVGQRRFAVDCQGKSPSMGAPAFVGPLVGEYYKGILALHKISPNWRLISEATSDFINDLFLYADRTPPRELQEKFQELFDVKFLIEKQRIKVKEGSQTYRIERSASGLKNLASFYLAARLDLADSFLFIDEPETALHPAYIRKWVEWIAQFPNYFSNCRIFIATHSEYVLEQFNVLLREGALSALTLWHAKPTSVSGGLFDSMQRFAWTSTRADADHPLDGSSLTKVYTEILRALYGESVE